MSDLEGQEPIQQGEPMQQSQAQEPDYKELYTQQQREIDSLKQQQTIAQQKITELTTPAVDFFQNDPDKNSKLRSIMGEAGYNEAKGIMEKLNLSREQADAYGNGVLEKYGNAQQAQEQQPVQQQIQYTQEQLNDITNLRSQLVDVLNNSGMNNIANDVACENNPHKIMQLASVYSLGFNSQQKQQAQPVQQARNTQPMVPQNKPEVSASVTKDEEFMNASYEWKMELLAADETRKQLGLKTQLSPKIHAMKRKIIAEENARRLG